MTPHLLPVNSWQPSGTQAQLVTWRRARQTVWKWTMRHLAADWSILSVELFNAEPVIPLTNSCFLLLLSCLPGEVENTEWSWWVVRSACSSASICCPRSPSSRWPTTGCLCCACCGHLQSKEHKVNGVSRAKHPVHPDWLLGFLPCSLL